MPRRIRPTVVHPPALREIWVQRIEDVTPNLRRVTFTGDQLGEFSPGPGAIIPPFASSGFDDDINLIFPHPGDSRPVLPEFVDGRWVWPKDDRSLGRHYTVRGHDPKTRELDVEFVRHGVGVAATWAYRAAPGDVLHIGGPSASLGLPDGFDWLLVAGDDTAVPAIARLLEELPVDARAQVIIEVAEATDQQALRELPGVTITWLFRDGAVGGSLLLDAVRGAEWWDGSAFAWVAGEQSFVRDARRHLVNDREMPKPHIEFVGYWKRTAAIVSGEDASLPDVEKSEEAAEKFHKQSELLPPLAIRLAIELGIGELIVAGVDTPAALAKRTGTVEWALRKFLRYLETIELVTADGDRYSLTESGVDLTEDWMIEMLKPGGINARLEQGLFGLGESLGSGRASYATVTGQDYEMLRSDAKFEHAFLDDRSQGADFLAFPLAASGALQGVKHLVVHGDIASAVAAAVTDADPTVQVTIVASSAQATWLREDLPRSLTGSGPARVSVAEEAEVGTIEPPDAVLMVDRLVRHGDADAARVLRQAADTLAPGGRLIVFEETIDVDDVDDHEAEADLLFLTLHGSGYRSDAEVDALAAAAGLTIAATEPCGWGDTLRTLTRA